MQLYYIVTVWLLYGYVLYRGQGPGQGDHLTMLRVADGAWTSDVEKWSGPGYTLKIEPTGFAETFIA